MADAKKCDRCGIFYDKYDGIPFGKKGSVICRTLKIYGPAGESWGYNFDMCPECMEELYSFLRSEKEQEK